MLDNKANDGPLSKVFVLCLEDSHGGRPYPCPPETNSIIPPPNGQVSTRILLNVAPRAPVGTDYIIVVGSSCQTAHASILTISIAEVLEDPYFLLASATGWRAGTPSYLVGANPNLTATVGNTLQITIAPLDSSDTNKYNLAICQAFRQV